MNFFKNLTVKYETDVFVAGGGAAGIAASVAAALTSQQKNALEVYKLRSSHAA